MTEGIIKFKGKFNQTFKDNSTHKFYFYLLDGNNLTCVYGDPDINEEFDVVCTLGYELINSKIVIDYSIAYANNISEQYLIMPFYDEENILNCVRGIADIPLYKFSSDISFRQVSKFQVDNLSNSIKFNFYAIVNHTLIINEEISMKVNLTKGTDSINSTALCTTKEEFQSSKGEEIQAEFICIIEGLENVQDYSGLEIISSNYIYGIPTVPDLLNPAKVDKLISAGLIKDYSLPENQIEKIPLFIPTSLNTKDIEVTGKFIINGGFKTPLTLNQSIYFEIFLASDEKVGCTLPKIANDDLEVQIECTLQKEINESIIYFPRCAVIDGYNEIIRLDKINSLEPINGINGKEKEYLIAFDTGLSFGQLSGFQVEGKIISFIFIGFSFEVLKKDESIEMIVNLIKGKELMEKTTVCKVVKSIETKDKK